jgi:hypothetical protein
MFTTTGAAIKCSSLIVPRPANVLTAARPWPMGATGTEKLVKCSVLSPFHVGDHSTPSMTIDVGFYAEMCSIHSSPS